MQKARITIHILQNSDLKNKFYYLCRTDTQQGYKFA